ncbi:MAG TPA: TRAM domain-containing protein [Candidatus Acetothermia bacterium]|nr:TRAM domain-containing protein [Candidatus Acetothermia bacterium]
MTKSSRLEDDVPPGVKNERLHRVLDLQRGIAISQNREYIGREVDVLIEGRTRDDRPYGRTGNHRTVVIDGEGEIGEFATVSIEDATTAALLGKRVDSMVPQGAQ